MTERNYSDEESICMTYRSESGNSFWGVAALLHGTFGHIFYLEYKLVALNVFGL